MALVLMTGLSNTLPGSLVWSLDNKEFSQGLSDGEHCFQSCYAQTPLSDEEIRREAAELLGERDELFSVWYSLGFLQGLVGMSRSCSTAL